MTVVKGSLSYRGARGAFFWLENVARDSLVGRFFLALMRVLAPVFADSRVFGTRFVESRRFGPTDYPVSVLAISRPYLWLRRIVGGGPVGRAAGSGGRRLRDSVFSGGGWAAVAGSGLFALGCGRLALLLARGVTTVDNTGLPVAASELRLVTPILVMAVGALMVVSGPRLMPAFRTGVIGRGLALATGGSVSAGPSVKAEESRSAGVAGKVLLGSAGILAAAAGLVAGLSYGSAPITLIAAVVALAVLAVVVVRPEALLVVLAAFPWLDWAARGSLGGLGAAWDDALLIFSICLLAWSVIVLRRWDLWTVPITLPLLLAFAVALGSVVVRHVPNDVALFALRILFQPLLFYFIGFLLPKDRRWVRRTVAVFVLAGVALALHGLYQYVTGAPMPAKWVDVRETSIGTRAYSIIQNPNGLGAFLLMGALVSLSLALARGLRRAPRLLWGSACVIHLAGIAVTFSRGAWIGLAAGIVALLVMAYRRYLIPLVAVGVVGWLAAPTTFVERLTSAVSSWYITKSMAAGRLYVWKIALQYVAAHPWFGLGLGTFGGTCAVTYSYGRLWVDSFYLQLAAEGGLVLLVFFLWMLLRGAKALARGYAATGDAYLRALTAGALGAYVAVAVANLTASVWETLVVGVGFWFLAGFATSAALHESAVPGEEPRGAVADEEGS